MCLPFLAVGAPFLSLPKGTAPAVKTNYSAAPDSNTCSGPQKRGLHWQMTSWPKLNRFNTRLVPSLCIPLVPNSPLPEHLRVPCIALATRARIEPPEWLQDAHEGGHQIFAGRRMSFGNLRRARRAAPVSCFSWVPLVGAAGNTLSP